MYLLSTRQILQLGFRSEDNRSSPTFCDKSGNAILLATPNLWGNIQIVKTYILKNNISNLVSFSIRYLNFETLYHCFGHTSNKVMCHIFKIIKDTKKIYFSV